MACESHEADRRTGLAGDRGGAFLSDAVADELRVVSVSRTVSRVARIRGTIMPKLQKLSSTSFWGAIISSTLFAVLTESTTVFVVCFVVLTISARIVRTRR